MLTKQITDENCLNDIAKVKKFKSFKESLICLLINSTLKTSKRIRIKLNKRSVVSLVKNEDHFVRKFDENNNQCTYITVVI